MFRITVLLVLMITVYKIEACEQPMILAFNGDWAPYLYKVDDNTYVGSDLDVLTATLNYLSCDIKVLSMPIQRAHLETQKGIIDVFIGASFTSKRNMTFYFSVPYRQEKVSFAVLDVNRELLKEPSLEAVILQGKKVVINMDGYFGETVEVLKKRYPTQFIHEFRLSDRMRRLSSGEIDIVIDDRDALCRNQKRYNNNAELANFVISDKIIHDDPVHFMFNRNTVKPEFIKLFNDTLEQVLEVQAKTTVDGCSLNTANSAF